MLPDAPSRIDGKPAGTAVRSARTGLPSSGAADSWTASRVCRCRHVIKKLCEDATLPNVRLPLRFLALGPQQVASMKVSHAGSDQGLSRREGSAGIECMQPLGIGSRCKRESTSTDHSQLAGLCPGLWRMMLAQHSAFNNYKALCMSCGVPDCTIRRCSSMEACQHLISIQNLSIEGQALQRGDSSSCQ